MIEYYKNKLAIAKLAHDIIKTEIERRLEDGKIPITAEQFGLYTEVLRNVEADIKHAETGLKSEEEKENA